MAESLEVIAVVLRLRPGMVMLQAGAPGTLPGVLVYDGCATLNVGDGSVVVAVDWKCDGRKDLLGGEGFGIVRL